MHFDSKEPLLIPGTTAGTVSFGGRIKSMQLFSGFRIQKISKLRLERRSAHGMINCRA